MNLKKKTPRVVLTLSWGCIHVYDRCSQKRLFSCISQISGERLQDHWPSSFLPFHVFWSVHSRCLYQHLKKSEDIIIEPRVEKTLFLHMRKQARRSTVQ